MKDDNIITILDSAEDNEEPGRDSGEDPFPSEIFKGAIVAVILAICFFLNTLSLVLTYQRQPDRNTTKPLPDIILDNLPFPVYDDGLYIAEVMIMFSVLSSIIVLALHRYRYETVNHFQPHMNNTKSSFYFLLDG